jgi:hypothetical protein
MFDIFAAVFMDWEAGLCYIWKFTEADLAPHEMYQFGPEIIEGWTSFAVCLDSAPPRKRGRAPNVWTAAHCVVRGKEMVFPPEAEVAGSAFFKAFRSPVE